jgi:hypothetical protein
VCRLCPGGLLAWACHPRTMGGCSVVGHTPHCHDLTWSLSLAVKIPRTSPRFVVTTPQCGERSAVVTDRGALPSPNPSSAFSPFIHQWPVGVGASSTLTRWSIFC